jgi:phospholipid/cholesterol/gamma-HCH transport system substrate-binding protein
MTRDTRIRLIAFAIVSFLGLTYVGGTYLGVVDRILGRGYNVDVLLPASGGIYEGAEVTYRGVKIGKVAKMTVDRDGLRVRVALQEDARVPASSEVKVDNLSAVGEQYISFEPTSSAGPMLRDGSTIRGNAESLPVGEDVLLQNLSAFVSDLDSDDVNVLIKELGTMFRDNATPLRSMVDSAEAFIAEAQANQTETISLLRDAQTVLETQSDAADDIQSAFDDLAKFTETLADADDDIETILEDAGPAAKEIELLVRTLRATLPSFLTHMIRVNDVLDARLPALEQLLVTFPRLIAAGPSALVSDSGDQLFGRVNLNLNQDPPACMEGYLPPKYWRMPVDEDFDYDFRHEDPAYPDDYLRYYDGFYPAQCESGPPVNMRGMNYAPEPTDWKSSLTGGTP